jgi:hypothetical protein
MGYQQLWQPATRKALSDKKRDAGTDNALRLLN